MRNWILVGITVFCLLIVGCNSEKVIKSKKYSFSDTCKIIKGSNSGDLLEIVLSSKKNPAQLELGEKLEFEVVYVLDSIEKAVIWLRPYHNGKKARGYNAHHLMSVKKGDPCVTTGWFFFKRPYNLLFFRNRKLFFFKRLYKWLFL